MASILTSVVLGAVHVAYNPYQSTDTTKVLASLSDKGRDDQSQSSDERQKIEQNILTNNPDSRAKQVVHKGGILTASETLASGQTYRVDQTIVVASGITLTVQEDVIINGANQTTSIKVVPGGQLKIQATDARPVHFVGQPSQNPNDSTAVLVEGGQASIQNTRFKNFKIALDVRQGSATATDNYFESSVRLAVPAYLSGNNFAVNNWYGPALDLHSNADISSINLDGPKSNHFSGSSSQIVVDVSGASVPNGKHWQISGGAGAIIHSDGLNVSGRLTIREGLVAKASKGNFLVMNEGAVVDIIGSASKPVIVTSAKDDSVAGDSNADGPSVATKGDYNTALVANGNIDLSVSHAILKYASNTASLTGKIDIQNTALENTNTAIKFLGGEISIEQTRILSALIGLDVTSGSAAIKDIVFEAEDKWVKACNSGTDNCAVKVISAWSESDLSRSCGQVSSEPDPNTGQVGKASDCSL